MGIFTSRSSTENIINGVNMNNTDRLNFELLVMDLCDKEECKTAEDYTRLAETLHESIEIAIQDMCMDNGIENYDPLY